MRRLLLLATKVPFFLLMILGHSGVVHSAPTTQETANLLCSEEGLMQLVPQFKGSDGHFAVPDPTVSLPDFLTAQQGLSNAIDMILAQQNVQGDPLDVSRHPNRPLLFGSIWLASEIGLKTFGKAIKPVDPQFGSYGSLSFLTGLTQRPESQGVMYAIKNEGKSIRYPALVYPTPTINPCVNRLTLAADDTAGFWPTPTYALGRYVKDSNGRIDPSQQLEAFLIVNICLDLGQSRTTPIGKSLRPMGQIVAAFHWPCPLDNKGQCPVSTKAHQH